MRKIIGIMIASVMLMGAFASMFTVVSAAPGTIRMDSNGDFPTYASAGNGSPGNPWIIDNLEIDGTGAGCCIYVGNTTEYFTIRNCTLKNADGMDGVPFYENAGIYIYAPAHGTITNNTILSNTGYGIILENSNFMSIHGNDIIANNLGMAQAWDNTGTNLWHNGYPDGGNFWGDLTAPDNKHGANQDIQGFDYIVDKEYTLDGGSGITDMYPLTIMVGELGHTSIEIESHEDGDYVSGIINIVAKTYGYDASGVIFYVNGTEAAFIPGSLFNYKFIFDTTGIVEDSSVLITAEAVLYNMAPINTSITLNINNVVEAGDFIDVTIMDSPYHPSEDMGIMITIQNAPPVFDKLNTRIGYEISPGQYNYFNRNNNPVAAVYMDNVFLQRDMSEGTHDLTVWAWGISNGETVWNATDTVTFEVTGNNLFETLAGMNTTILAELENVNASLASNISDLLTSITDDISDMNSTVGAELQDLLTEVDTNDAALTDWLDTVLAFIDKNTTDTNQNVPKLDTILANLTALSEALDNAETELNTAIEANAPPEAKDNTPLLMAILALVVVSMLISLLAFMASSKLGKNIDGLQSEPTAEPEPTAEQSVDEPESIPEPITEELE